MIEVKNRVKTLKLKSIFKKDKKKVYRTIENRPNFVSGEIWAKIPNYPDYQISNTGRIKSFKGSKCKFMSSAYCSNGYEKLILRNENGPKNFTVHRLVAESFVKNPFNKKEVNHKNGIKSDNQAKNLEWVTRKENIRHSYETGLKVNRSGEKCPNAKLNEINVLTLKTFIPVKKYTNIELAKIYNITPSTVSVIKNGRTWGHIKSCSRDDILTQWVNESIYS